MSPTTSDTSSTTSNGSGLARNGSTSAFRAALGAKFGTAAVAGGGGSPGQDGTMTPVPLTPLPYELTLPPPHPSDYWSERNIPGHGHYHNNDADVDMTAASTTTTASDDTVGWAPGARRDLRSSASASAAAGKRKRRRTNEDGEEGAGSRHQKPEWTEWEDGLLQSFLANPPRPLRNPFPPGTLPESATLDELTNQALPALAERHSWKDARARLFEIARLDSKGLDPGETLHPKPSKSTSGASRQGELPAATSIMASGGTPMVLPAVLAKNGNNAIGRGTRPGVKRVSSMDFLDDAAMIQHSAEQESDSKNDSTTTHQVPAPASRGQGLGKVLQLSTSLQKSSKVNQPPAPLNLPAPVPVPSLSSPIVPPVPPFSPIVPITPAITTPAPSSRLAPPLTRTPSTRSRTASRPTSLLQRGKSFTAQDLDLEGSSTVASTTTTANADAAAAMLALPMKTPDRFGPLAAAIRTPHPAMPPSSSPMGFGGGGGLASSPISTTLDSSPIEIRTTNVDPDQRHHLVSPSPSLARSSRSRGLPSQALPTSSSLTPKLTRSMSSLTAAQAETSPRAKQHMFLAGAAAISTNATANKPSQELLSPIALEKQPERPRPREKKRLKGARLASPFDA